MDCIKYTPEHATEWNEFIRSSKNGTFLLDRNYMDYHSDRFEDCSVMFIEKERIFAVFPANINRDKGIVYSHQGLTYGGLIMGREINAARVLEAFSTLTNYYKEEYGAKEIIIKPTPRIYSNYPSEEQDYALFRMNAKLISRGISSTIVLNDRIPLERSRRNALKKAARYEMRVEHDSEEYEAFWAILNQVLTTRHDVTPVHTPAELKLLHDRFPDYIHLTIIRNEEGRIIAGVYYYICGQVIHTQYMSASDEARHCGALELLIESIISRHSNDCKYLDFGISTENGGRLLNEGLIYQKEGFGGRGVCYDAWELATQS